MNNINNGSSDDINNSEDEFINFENDSEEILSVSNSGSQFSVIIGCIEDILIDVEFTNLQNYYLEKYWMVFENIEENKLIYMDIFNEYTQSIENHIVTKLVHLVPDFDIHTFIADLVCRKDELDGEVFDMFFTLADFNEFKQMFLDYRANKEGTIQDLSPSIHITSIR